MNIYYEGLNKKKSYNSYFKKTDIYQLSKPKNII